MSSSSDASRPGTTRSSRMSSRKPTPLNTDIDIKGRTPEEYAAIQKIAASEEVQRKIGALQQTAADSTENLAVALRLLNSSSGVRPSTNGSATKFSSAVSRISAFSAITNASSSKREALPDNQVQDFIEAFQTSIQSMPMAAYTRFLEDDERVDRQDQARQLLFRVFKSLSATEGEEQGKHANSMDLNEFLNACEALCIVPGPLIKKDAIRIFKDVNQSSSEADYDQHEMNRYEFVKAIDVIGKSVGIPSLEDLCFGEAKKIGLVCLEDREKRREKIARVAVVDLKGVDLSNLNIKMMKKIMKIFQSLADENSAEPELNQMQFVKVFTPILQMTEREIQLLFMKIDVNSDGMVSWNEFSTYVLNLNAKEEAAQALDSIVDNSPPFGEQDATTHHEDCVVAAAHMPKLGLICTAGNDGYIRLWNGSTGNSAGGKSMRAVPPTKAIMSLTVLQQSSMVVVGGDDCKIRFFDPYSLRHELTFDCDGRWPFSMTSFLYPDEIKSDEFSKSLESLIFDDPMFASDKKGYSGWFVWGDGEGRINFMPEKQVLSFRTQHEVVPFFRSGVKGRWDLWIFKGQDQATTIWVTSLLFLGDVGLAGCILAAASNGHVCVVSIENRRVFHYYFQHRLSVKVLAWCGRQNNMLASAGLDREIHLWRPVAIRDGKPITAGSLTGHGVGVTCMVYHEKRDVLFSLDSHCITLVWDLSSKSLLTKINPLTQNPFDIAGRVKFILVNQRSRHLIMATNHLKFWGVRALDLHDGTDKLVPHASEIVIALYNTTFDLILTGDRNGLVSLWNVKTGAQQFKFYCESVQETFGPPVLSAASFDISQRRLILGWNQGSVQIYNFSNGTLLLSLATDTTMKVTAVGQYSFERSSELHQYFTAAFEDGLLLQWADIKRKSENDKLQAPTRKIEVPSWMGQEVAVNAMAEVAVNAMADVAVKFSEVAVNAMAGGTIGSGQDAQSVLLTVRNDGIAFFWDITTGFLLRPHNARGKKNKGEKDPIKDERQDGTLSYSRDDERVTKQTATSAKSSSTEISSRENLCLQVSDSPKISITCTKILHKCPHIAFIGDAMGIIHIVNMATGKRTGSVSAASRSGRFVGDDDYLPCINAMDIDFTDSFLMVGDEMGELQVWDISQIFDDHHDPTMSLIIDAFRWKAHEQAVTRVQHLRKHNLIITAGREERGVCIIWTVSGHKIGCLGDARWTPDSIRKALEMTGSPQEVLEDSYEEEEDEVPLPHYEKVVKMAVARLDDQVGLLRGSQVNFFSKKLRIESQKGMLQNDLPMAQVELSILKGILNKDRKIRGMKTSVFKVKDRSWEAPSGGEDTPEQDRLEIESREPKSLRGQLSILIEELNNLPSADKFSKADPFVKLRLGDFKERRTRTFLNQANAQVHEVFLYYIDTLDQRLKFEVWDSKIDVVLRDPTKAGRGEDHHDLIGCTDNSLQHLLASPAASNFTGSFRLPLMRPDGTGSGKLGSISFKLEFQPIESTLIKMIPHTVSDSIRIAFKNQGVLHVPPLKSIKQPDPEVPDRSVTAIATSRWKSSDFRNLPVYHLQKDLKLNHGASTERNTDRTRGARAGRMGNEDSSAYGQERQALVVKLEEAQAKIEELLSGAQTVAQDQQMQEVVRAAAELSLQLEFQPPSGTRFTKETFAGRLERDLGRDLRLADSIEPVAIRIPGAAQKKLTTFDLHPSAAKQNGITTSRDVLELQHRKYLKVKPHVEAMVQIHGVNRKLQMEQESKQRQLEKLERSKDNRSRNLTIQQQFDPTVTSSPHLESRGGDQVGATKDNSMLPPISR